MLAPDGAPPCRCRTLPAATVAATFHNGHALVVPKSCTCPRRYRHANRTSGARRRRPPGWAPINQRIPGAKKDWAFVQHQWLMSPDTTGWLGGVHSPVPRRAPSPPHHHHHHHRRRPSPPPPPTEHTAARRLPPPAALPPPRAQVRIVQQYMMLAAKLTSYRSLAAGLQYVTLLRHPIRRFLSEFYETYDGWELNFLSWPRVATACPDLFSP
jgi:hypothetical protein